MILGMFHESGSLDRRATSDPSLWFHVMSLENGGVENPRVCSAVLGFFRDKVPATLEQFLGKRINCRKSDFG